MRRPLIFVALVGLALLAVITMTEHPAQVEVLRGPGEVGISPGSAILDTSDDELQADLDAMVELGATWIRIDIDWSRIEPEPGRWEWDATDRVMRAARDRGLNVLGLLAYSASWARPADTSNKHAPDDVGAFATFAATAADRYLDDGVVTWELWNEPNSADFWQPRPDPTAYASLVMAATEAIRRVSPDATIMTGGLAPSSDDPPDAWSPRRFLETMYETLPPGTVDAVAIHPYSFPADPTDDTKSWNLYAQLPGLRLLVERAEGAPTPVWITEFGAPYDEDDPERQAEIVVEGVQCALTQPDPPPVFVYALHDAPEDPGDRRFGLLTADRAERPVWFELRSLVRSPADDLVRSRCPATDDTDEPAP